MGDVVHLDFDARHAAKGSDSLDWHPLEMVGQAAGYVVGLVRETSLDGPVIRVVVGRVGGTAVESIALVPDHPGRFNDALNCAIAALRTLEVVL